MKILQNAPKTLKKCAPGTYVAYKITWVRNQTVNPGKWAKSHIHVTFATSEEVFFSEFQAKTCVLCYFFWSGLFSMGYMLWLVPDCVCLYVYLSDTQYTYRAAPWVCSKHRCSRATWPHFRIADFDAWAERRDSAQACILTSRYIAQYAVFDQRVFFWEFLQHSSSWRTCRGLPIPT